jgi:hypothetical protein
VRSRAGRVALLLSLGLAACDAAPPERRAQARDLDPGDVALVANERIDGETVRAIAAAQGVSLTVARDRAIRDALFAVEARARGREPRSAESALLARTLLEQRRRELDGPVTDAELAEATRRHWLELDRPEGARVVHVVVLVKAKPPPTEASWASAEAVGKAIADAAGSVSALARDAARTDAEVLAELQRVAASVEHRGLETKAEALPATAADGRVLASGGGRMAPEFATAIATLRARGEVTPPFRSPYGVHVAVLLERTAAVSVPADERRALVHDEVLDRRLAKERTALAAPLASTVEVATNAAALLELVTVGDATTLAARPK